MHKKILSLILLGTSTYFTMSSLTEAQPNISPYPFYIGVTGGYGSTTWGHLVPKDPNAAMSISTPTSVREGGAVWGIFGGYELGPMFALEGAYTRYPTAKLYFDPFSLFTFDYDGRTELTTKIETVSFMMKLMLFIPNTSIRGYSSAGIDGTHRSDAVKNLWRANPTFGAGFNYNLSDHWMSEIGINYTAGYGASEINPTKDFVPFLYSAFLRLAYRF